jgi:hypothetical protein
MSQFQALYHDSGPTERPLTAENRCPASTVWPSCTAFPGNELAHRTFASQAESRYNEGNGIVGNEFTKMAPVA